MTTYDTRWAEQRRRLQLRWPALTEEDLDSTGGDREALIGLLQARLGYAVGNAEGDLDEILAGETVVPRDVADEDTHTGTSGPVGNGNVPSGASGERLAQSNAPNSEASRTADARSGIEYTHATFDSYEASASSSGRTTRPAWQVPALAIAVLTVLAAGWVFM